MSPMSSYARSVLTGTPVHRDRPTVINIVSAPPIIERARAALRLRGSVYRCGWQLIVGGARQPRSELAQRRRSLCAALRPIDPAGIASRRIGIREEVYAVEENGR